VPIATQFRRQDRIDNASPAYVGDLGLGANPALEARVAEADLVVLLGGRFGEIPSGGYARLPQERRLGHLVAHVHAESSELGRTWHPDLAIAATAPLVVDGLVARGPLGRPPRAMWA
jgi:acetolactate synthase-1/2/3 large subunit